MTNGRNLTVAIDTTSDTAGVALFEGDTLLSELTWHSRLSHSRDLLPGLEWLLQRASRSRDAIAGVAVCLGPGSYAGMRVGVSTAKALAYGLGASLAGVGRLEADALPFAGAAQSRIVAVHAAGRAELAWAAYVPEDGALREAVAPGLTPVPELGDRLDAADLVCGEPASLPAIFLDSLARRGVRFAAVHPSRVVAVGRIGLRRLAAGLRDDPNSLLPLYLRAPAIGPQPPAG